MPDMYEIVSKLMKNEPLSIEERFKYLRLKKADSEVFEYLSSKFNNLTIECFKKYKGYISGDLLDLMKQGLLEGYCFQTTETSSLFLNDDDYIERGYLRFSMYKVYYHAWICFKYNEELYGFDPCLNLLCKKDLYTKIFETDVKAKISAKEVREDLAIKVSSLKQKEKIHIIGSEDINSPMYRNDTRYKFEYENGKVKKLTAHYYERSLI